MARALMQGRLDQAFNVPHLKTLEMELPSFSGEVAAAPSLKQTIRLWRFGKFMHPGNRNTRRSAGLDTVRAVSERAREFDQLCTGLFLDSGGQPDCSEVSYE